MAFVAALATALSVLLMIWAAPAAVSWRLQTVGSGVAGHVREPACGTSVMLSSIIASLQAGAALEPALERAYDSVCAPRVGSGHAHHVRAPTVAGAGHAAGVYAVCDGEGNVDAAQMARLFAACRLPHERASHCTQVACGVAVASAVSLELGCPAARCIEAVRAGYLRARLQDDLRANAFAMPKSTARMLLALPAVVVFLGELLGEDPLGMLFGSAQGLAMLCLGTICYVGGLLWMHCLLASDG